MISRGILTLLLVAALLLAPVSCATTPGDAEPDSTDGYAPPPEPERPVLDEGIPGINPTVGIAAGAAGVLAGLLVSSIGVHRAIDAADGGYHARGVQSGIVLSGSGVILSSLSAILIDRSRGRAAGE